VLCETHRCRRPWSLGSNSRHVFRRGIRTPRGRNPTPIDTAPARPGRRPRFEDHDARLLRESRRRHAPGTRYHLPARYRPSLRRNHQHRRNRRPSAQELEAVVLGLRSASCCATRNRPRSAPLLARSASSIGSARERTPARRDSPGHLEALRLMTARFQPIDKLPLFACEEAIATALLGPGKYAFGSKSPLY
jgi:hypothetical protein